MKMKTPTQVDTFGFKRIGTETSGLLKSISFFFLKLLLKSISLFHKIVLTFLQCLCPEVELLKERMAKLLRREDISGSGKEFVQLIPGRWR